MERGHQFLKDNQLEPWLDSCPLIASSHQFKDSSGFDIFLECRKWVSTEGIRKVEEIIYDKGGIQRDDFIELLALAIRDRILATLKKQH